jgi:transcription initiation factor TFIID subunit TAF12
MGSSLSEMLALEKNGAEVACIRRSQQQQQQQQSGKEHNHSQAHEMQRPRASGDPPMAKPKGNPKGKGTGRGT